MKQPYIKRLCAWLAVVTSIAILMTACGQEPAASTAANISITMATATITSVTTTVTTTTSTTMSTTTTVTTTSVTTTEATTTTTTTTTTRPTTSPTHIVVNDVWADGVTPSLWRANCNDYITLRPAPNSNDSIITIPAGDTMILLGWDGMHAKVSYYGLEGYVMAYWIAPAGALEAGLSVVPITNSYTYAQMCADIDTLCARYPDVCRRDSIGKSEQGRDIPVLKLGSESASHHVLIQGAIHGLEYTTAWLMMAMADSAASHGAVPQDVCFHMIPMSNPDGVTLAQSGVLNDVQRGIYISDVQAEYTKLDEIAYATQWKANANGVDLNRNFDAGWTVLNGRPSPSSQRYKGDAPFCAAESKALRDYTLSRTFDATISYHATGSIIYYEYGPYQPVNDLSFDLGGAVKSVTGYPRVGWDTVEGGGYKDWAMEKLGIPSLTIEIGCEDTPLVYQEIYNVLYRNLPVLDAVADWVKR